MLSLSICSSDRLRVSCGIDCLFLVLGFELLEEPVSVEIRHGAEILPAKCFHRQSRWAIQ
jgi:hypothetical protein